MWKYNLSTLKVLLLGFLAAYSNLCFSNENLSPYQAVKNSSHPFTFNVGGEWIAAEKTVPDDELNRAVATISKWDKPEFISKFCSGLGKTFQKSFIEKNNKIMDFNVEDFGGSKSVMGCVFNWRTPKGHPFKTISTVEKGADSKMYMFTLYR